MDVQLDNQRYAQSTKQQKEMFLGKVANHMERLGGRFEGQDARTKLDIRDSKFSEIDKILNAAPQRYDNQRIATSTRVQVREGSPIGLDPLGSRLKASSEPFPKPLADHEKKSSLSTKIMHKSTSDLHSVVKAVGLPPTTLDQPAPPMKQIGSQNHSIGDAETTRSQELDQFLDSVFKNKRWDEQAAVSDRILLPGSQGYESAKMKELDQVADLMFKSRRWDDQASEPSRVHRASVTAPQDVTGTMAGNLKVASGPIFIKSDDATKDLVISTISDEPKAAEERFALIAEEKENDQRIQKQIDQIDQLRVESTPLQDVGATSLSC
jgi:hypothetical protein